MSKRDYCYIGNWNGRYQGLVIAPNMKEAAMIAKTSFRDFSNYWSRHEELPSDLERGVLYIKKYDTGTKWERKIWQEIPESRGES